MTFRLVICGCLLTNVLLAVASNASTDQPTDIETEVNTGSERVKKYHDKKLIRLSPRSEEEVSIIAEKLSPFTNDTIDFWIEPNYSLKPVDVMIDSHTLPLIRHFASSNNLSDVHVLQENVQSLIDSIAVPSMRSAEYRSEGDLEHFFRDFQRYSSINSYIEQLARKYPSMVTIESIGKSFEDRNLTIVRVSAKGGKNHKRKRFPSSATQNKEIIFIDAGFHAREWLAPATALYFTYLITSRYNRDELTTEILDTFDFVILPVANPDGYEYSHTRERMWRKTRSKAADTKCIGTDPNRNFDYHWMESGSSSRPCLETFAGSSAFTEPETRALAKYLWAKRSNIRVYISLHSYSQLWLYPWGYERSRPENDGQLATKARAAVNAIKKVYGTDFKYGPSGQVLYPAAGGSDDWALAVCKIPYAYTVELRPNIGSSNGFLVSSSEIIPSGVETTAGILALARDIMENGDKVY